MVGRFLKGHNGISAWACLRLAKRLGNATKALTQSYLLNRASGILSSSARGGAIYVSTLFNMVKARGRLTIGIEPLSHLWGHDRGVAIHRYYVNEFLREYAYHIRGHCMEFNDPEYTNRFGGGDVEKVDILHIDNSNKLATMVADLTKPNDIPSNLFDCIICTHVFHVIFELNKAVEELHRILKPGGVLLVAVPQISMCDPNEHELWRFTPEGLHRLLGNVFGMKSVTIHCYGNSLAAAGEIRGLVTCEFTNRELAYRDGRFGVEVCARAVKVDRMRIGSSF